MNARTAATTAMPTFCFVDLLTVIATKHWIM